MTGLPEEPNEMTKNREEKILIATFGTIIQRVNMLTRYP
jgi:hypothetical protein